MYQLMKIILKRADEAETLECSELYLEGSQPEEINLAEIYEGNSFTLRNNHQTSCFNIDILFDLQRKNPSILSKYLEKKKVNLQETFDRFKTKLADYGDD